MGTFSHESRSRTPATDYEKFHDVDVVALRCTATGKIHPLERKVNYMLGSHPDCNIHLEQDQYISKLHCSLERNREGRVIVRDRGSTNGTLIGGHRIAEAELRAGAYLQVGYTNLVALGGIPSAAPKAAEILVGHDPVLLSAVQRATKAAHADCNVLIIGETGTGKDVLARLVHESSRRAMNRFVPVNCGAIPKDLIGSELFGHEKGAFTGAIADRDGYFVEAHNGTLFLDEIGELPLEQQPQLLRVIESRQVRRVGGMTTRNVDVRIIAATNRFEGLGSARGDTPLRIDLFHRIATVVLTLPPLRERKGDLCELVENQLLQLAPQYGPLEITGDAWTAMANYSWPGNVRELIHTLRRGAALCEGNRMTVDDLFPDFIAHPREKLVPMPQSGPVLSVVDRTLRGMMEHALMTKGSMRAAAKALGMPKSTFAEKARAWGLLKVRKDT